jgi:BirA family biotin operon repressor/biotin-[acetyl-CoA-carboxylase] ligase
MATGTMHDEARFDLTLLHSLLETQFVGVGERLVYLPEVASTNTLAMKLAHERSDEGLVVLTDSQTAGKGRQGRRWVDTPGCNILSSTLLRPVFPPHLLVMIASLAVVEAIEQTCGAQTAIKWPNDVLIDGRKVCGILIETSHDQNGHLVAVLGIGINANGQLRGQVEQKGVEVELATIATTLETACGHPVSREEILARVLTAIEREYLTLQQEAIEPPVVIPTTTPAARLLRERWQSHLATLGRTIKVHQGDNVVEGVAEAVNDNGELLLRRHSGELVCITWGVVDHFPRLATYP